MVSRALAIVGLVVFAPASLSGCGGSTPTSPNQSTCAPVVAPTSTRLSVGDLFRFKFAVPSGANADVLMTFIGVGASGSSESVASFRLYDGANLLGVLDNYRDSVGIWKSPDSLFGAPGSPYGLSGPAVVVNFHSIVSGTIDGRVEYSVTRGSMFVEHLEQATVMLLNPANQDSFSFGNPVITARELCR